MPSFMLFSLFSRNQYCTDKFCYCHRNQNQPNQLAVVDGLIIQAARLRVSLDKLQEEINKDGLTQWFTQSPEKTPPYKRITPASDLFVKMDKSYQSIIKQLNDLTPPDKTISALEAFQEEDEQ